MNTIIPQAWIIQEKIRREQAAQRRENNEATLPASLPQSPELDEYDPGELVTGAPRPESTVIIIDI